MKLLIYGETWKKISKMGDNAIFPKNINFKNKLAVKFRRYVDLANYLDSHQEFKNKVMLVSSSNCGLSKKVIFSDPFVFVEGRGFI